MRIFASILALAAGAWAEGWRDNCTDTMFVRQEYEGVERIHLQALCTVGSPYVSLPLDKCMGNADGRLVWRKE